MITALFTCIFFNALGLSVSVSFSFPSPKDDSTSEPYKVYLLNTFPTEIQTLRNGDYKNSTVYSEFVDLKIGTPLYAGKDWSLSRRVYVEAFINHVRALNPIKAAYASPETCQIANNPWISTSRRFASIFHELNVPFEVPCLTCQSLDESAPNFFRVIDQRKTFTYDLLSKSKPIANVLRAKADENLFQIYGADISVENPDADGSLRWSPRLIPESDSMNPQNEALENPSTKLADNSMSLFCAKEKDGILQSPEIIINVDTLKIPPLKGSVLVQDNVEFYVSDKHRFLIDDLISWEAYKEDSKLPIENKAFNLKIDISWEKWSCCSACCCSDETCGDGFGISSTACEQISSYRTRRGFLSFFKIDHTQPLNILTNIENFLQGTQFFDSALEETVQTFDLYLSSLPYATTGIAVHSTLLQNNHAWLLLEAFLNEHFHYRVENGSGQGSQLGMFVDSQACSDKLNCTKLQLCLDKETYNYESDESVVTPLSSTTSKPRDHDMCDYHGIEDITIAEKDSVVPVEEGQSYRFSVDENEYGELSSAYWTMGHKKVPQVNPKKSCDAQKVFVKGYKLVILALKKEDGMLPYIVHAVPKATEKEITLKISLQFQPAAKESKYGSQVITWIAIAGGVLAAFIIVVIVIHVIQVRTLKRKLQQAAASKNGQTAENL